MLDKHKCGPIDMNCLSLLFSYPEGTRILKGNRLAWPKRYVTLVGITFLKSSTWIYEELAFIKKVEWFNFLFYLFFYFLTRTLQMSAGGKRLMVRRKMWIVSQAWEAPGDFVINLFFLSSQLAYRIWQPSISRNSLHVRECRNPHGKSPSLITTC